jgi:K+-transporting ATPase A subunit
MSNVRTTAGADPRAEMDWKQYTISFLLYSLFEMLLYPIARLQLILHTFDLPYQPTALARTWR